MDTQEPDRELISAGTDDQCKRISENAEFFPMMCDDERPCIQLAGGVQVYAYADAGMHGRPRLRVSVHTDDLGDWPVDFVDVLVKVNGGVVFEMPEKENDRMSTEIYIVTTTDFDGLYGFVDEGQRDEFAGLHPSADVGCRVSRAMT